MRSLISNAHIAPYDFSFSHESLLLCAYYKWFGHFKCNRERWSIYIAQSELLFANSRSQSAINSVLKINIKKIKQHKEEIMDEQYILGN